MVGSTPGLKILATPKRSEAPPPLLASRFSALSSTSSVRGGSPSARLRLTRATAEPHTGTLGRLSETPALKPSGKLTKAPTPRTAPRW